MKRFLLVLLAACGGPQRDATPPPAPDAAPAFVFDEATAQETADGLLDVLATMTSIAEQRADDCVAMAEDLGALFDRAEPIFEIARTAEQDPEHSRLLVAAMKRHEGQVGPLVERLAPRLQACRGEPKLVEVMERMPVL